MKRPVSLSGMLLILIFMTGCKKNVLEDGVFNSPQSRYELAVEGGFNTLKVDQYIKLTKPALHADSLPTPVSKARVVVNDGRVDIIYYETTIKGVYKGVSRGDPNYNGAYKLTIKLNEKTYTAVDTLRQVVNIVDDFLPLSTRVVEDQKIEGNIPKHTFGYVNPNKWYISYGEIPIWNPAKFDQTKYYSYTHFLGSPNSLYPLNNLKRTFSLKSEEFIYIYKISLSAKYAQYLYSVFMETDWNGLFSGVPVNIEGNISGNVQGFFSVVDVDARRYRAKEL
ncbi:hypothetical protein [Pedobacter sp. UYP24]